MNVMDFLPTLPTQYNSVVLFVGFGKGGALTCQPNVPPASLSGYFVLGFHQAGLMRCAPKIRVTLS